MHAAPINRRAYSLIPRQNAVWARLHGQSCGAKLLSLMHRPRSAHGSSDLLPKRCRQVGNRDPNVAIACLVGEPLRRTRNRNQSLPRGATAIQPCSSHRTNLLPSDSSAYRPTSASVPESHSQNSANASPTDAKQAAAYSGSLWRVRSWIISVRHALPSHVLAEF
jgi:hypothetical protein